jgi:glycosyltransferase involved in cell wall biosynthesis
MRLAEIQPDLVVTHSINAHVVGHLIARRARAAHVTNEHFNVGPGRPKRLHRELLSRLVGPRVDGAIAIANIQVPRLVELGYRPQRIRIIYNGVSHPVPVQPRSHVRKQLGVREDEILALLVATLRPEKEAHVFLEAVREAHRADARIRGLIVGAGPDLHRLKNLAGSDGIVQVLGERLDVPDLVNAADVSCLSSAAEGIPMSLLEAMALGKPVVATNVGGITEAVIPEETGVLVPVGDHPAFASALLRLASNAEFAHRLGEAGRERHRALFSLQRMIADYERAFEEILAARHRPRSASERSITADG